MSQLQLRIKKATETAMKARDKPRVAALRLIGAELKRVEVDERRSLEDQDVIAALTRMAKQRNDSLSHYVKAGRDDLAGQERFELELIASFLPEPLSEADIDAFIDAAIADLGASGMRDMGKVMGRLREEMQGRANMGAVSAKVKARLA